MHITILCAPGGSGHIQAAKALQAHAQRYPNITISCVNISSFFPTYINHLVFDSYNWSVQYTPFIWKYIYTWTNNHFAIYILKMIVWCISKIYTKRVSSLTNQIYRQHPHWIICTHPIARLFVQKNNSTRVSMVITDYGLHSSWVSDSTDTFFIPIEQMIPEIIQYGVQVKQCVVTGIPVHPVFFEKKEVMLLKQRYDIHPKKKIFLILTGGEGLVDPTALIKELFTLQNPITLIVITGHNINLQQTLTTLPSPMHISYHVIGWTDSIDEYMRIADYIITKPGGITITECLTLQKPMILISPIPGQEEKNCRILCQIDAAIHAKTTKDIHIFLQTKKILTQKKLPNASQIIFDHILTQNTNLSQ